MNLARTILFLWLTVLAVPLVAVGQTPTPVIHSLGSGCDNWDCVWITGQGFQSTSRVWIANPSDWTGQWFYGPALATYPALNITTDGASISFQITDANLRSSFGNAGLWVVVVNSGDIMSAWRFVQSPPPVVTAAWAGCADSYCIWMTGWFPLNATIDFRPHGQPGVLSNSYYGLSVGLNQIALGLNSNARTAFDTSGLDVWVVNAPLANWSGGNYIPALDRSVIGHVDGMSVSGSQYYLRGWACAKNDADSIDVHVYRGGPYGSGGTFAFAAAANAASEPAIAAACNSYGSAYRFSIPIPPAFLQQYAGQPIYVHGISPFGYGNPLLGNSGTLIFPGGGSSNTKEYIYLGDRLLAVDTTNLP